jgi:hypothetical protein
MSTLFDATRVPDDGEYWDALAARVAAHVARESRRGGVDWLAHSRASWVAASLLLAAALAFMVRPAEHSRVTIHRAEWAEAFAPADDVGKAIVARDRPPAIGALLFADQGAVR